MRCLIVHDPRLACALPTSCPRFERTIFEHLVSRLDDEKKVRVFFEILCPRPPSLNHRLVLWRELVVVRGQNVGHGAERSEQARHVENITGAQRLLLACGSFSNSFMVRPPINGKGDRVAIARVR